MAENANEVFLPNYKLSFLIPERSYAAIHGPNIRTDALRGVAESFYENMMRVDFLALMPAAFTACGILFGQDNELYLTFNSEPVDQIVSTNAWWFAKDGYNPEAFRTRMRDVMPHVQHWAMQQGPSMDAWLSSLVVGTWTTFEAFAGDLWYAAVNANPHYLARLAGTAKRIHQQAKAAIHEEDAGTSGQGAGANKQERGMQVRIERIHDITGGTYNLSSRMGKLLQGKVAFTRLWDIRKAYSLAFDEEKIDQSVVSAVDGALADGALDALAAVRNLIVHKASVADEEYRLRMRPVLKAGLTVPVLEEGQTLHMDGAVVKALTDPVVACCLKLFAVVDGWLGTDPSPPGYIAGLGI